MLEFVSNHALSDVICLLWVAGVYSLYVVYIVHHSFVSVKGPGDMCRVIVYAFEFAASLLLRIATVHGC